MAAARPRVAARDALRRHPRAAQRAVRAQRVERVLRAARVVAAAAGRRAARQERGDHVAPGEHERRAARARRPAQPRSRRRSGAARERARAARRSSQSSPRPSAVSARPGPRDAHDVDAARRGGAELGERLAQEPLQAVPLDGAADLARDRQAEARLVGVPRLAREGVDDEVARGRGPASPVDGVELGGSREPAPAFRLGRGHSDQAESRLRPRARRRLMMTRPARVDIRLRKPCVFARLRRFGW